MELTSKSSFKKQIFKSFKLGEDTVYMRVMSGNELDSWHAWIDGENQVKDATPLKNVYASLIVRCLCDAGGIRIYRDEELGEVAEMPATVLKSLYEFAADLNFVSAQAKEDLKKNNLDKECGS